MWRFAKLKLLTRNKQLWLSGISVTQKLAFYVTVPVSHLRHLTTRKKKIRYFGEDFYYDNLATPLCLMTYPYEITAKVQHNLGKKISSVLDIGGNIGQFSVTMKKLVKPKTIDILEPNPEIYDILVKNVSRLKGVRTFNVGVGESTDGKMFFEEGRSGLGSLIKKNAGRQNRVHQVNINLVQDISKITKKKHYDLVKIDVEGYESHVLKQLKSLSFNYLFIELSGGSRVKDYKHSEILELIKNNVGDYDILHTSESNLQSPSFEVLLKFT